MGLKKSREALHNRLVADGGQSFRPWALAHRSDLSTMIQTWRDALKASERKETFERAYDDKRMSVRSFGADFSGQVHKKIQDFAIVGTNRIRPDSQYVGKFATGKQRDISDDFHKSADFKRFYDPERGLDSAAFAVPANFATRQLKYSKGLHDLSASLLNPDVPLFDQVHHKEDQGAFFSFLPLPDEGDQALLYQLTRAAKLLKAELPLFYDRVRELRAEITRVKLASENDMAIGYSIVPVANPRDGDPKYKLRYGLGDTTNPVEGETPNAKATAAATTLTLVRVTQEVYQARQQAGINYKGILPRALRRTDGKKTEIIIALRQHDGPFPVFGIRVGDVVKEITISTGAPVETGRTLPLKYA